MRYCVEHYRAKISRIATTRRCIHHMRYCTERRSFEYITSWNMMLKDANRETGMEGRWSRTALLLESELCICVFGKGGGGQVETESAAKRRTGSSNSEFRVVISEKLIQNNVGQANKSENNRENKKHNYKHAQREVI